MKNNEELINYYSDILNMNLYDCLRNFYDNNSNNLSKEIYELLENDNFKLSKELCIVLIKVADKYLDTEISHSLADDIIIKYIDDKDIANTFDSIDKWYA